MQESLLKLGFMIKLVVSVWSIDTRAIINGSLNIVAVPVGAEAIMREMASLMFESVSWGETKLKIS